MDKIIVKFLQNKCSEEEKASLFSWIEHSQENLAYFNKMRQLWDLNSVSFSQISNNEQLDEAFHNVQQKLKDKKSAKDIQYVKTRFIRPLIRYAAIAIICFGLSWFFWQHRTENAEVSWQTIEVPAGQRANITLIDGTRVWLNSKTKLTYPQSFSHKNRIVKLEGEAYFEVFHDENAPFLVKTNFINFTVTGTKFNVYAYDNEPIIEAVLVEGKVVFSENKPKGIDMEMRHNQMFIYNSSTSRLKILNNVDTQAITTWISGTYSFKNTSLLEIIPRLENYYDIPIEVRDSSILNYTCTGKFRSNESLNDVLKVLSTGKPFKYNISETRVLIY